MCGLGAEPLHLTGGSGLVGLRRRADALSARLLVGDRPDGPGFRVRVEVPS